MIDPSHRLRKLLALFVAAAAAGCAPGQPRPSETYLNEVQQTVLRLENEMNLAVDGLDCAIPESGDREPIFVSGGQVIRTGSELRDMCRDMVANRTGAVFAADHITANVLSSDVAYVVREGNYTINFKDGTSVTPYLVMTTIWHREGGEWKMVHLHESGRQP